MRTTSYTSDLRARASALLAPCPTCKRPTLSVRDLAAQVGVSHSTLWRFLAGKAPSAKLVDALTAFLGPPG